MDYYNNHRVHEAPDNLAPAYVYHGRADEISDSRNMVKEQTLRRRKRQNRRLTPLNEEIIRPEV